MSEQLIDDFDGLKTEGSRNRLVKILVFALTLFLLFLNVIGGKVVHLWIVQFYEFRHKYAGLVSNNLIISALSISIIPLIVYRIWMKVPMFKTWKSYLFMLLSVIVLFVGFFVLGLELILQTAIPNENPLLPSYIFIPRLPFSFSLLFILSTVMSFLTLKFVFRKKKKRNGLKNGKLL